MQTAEANKHLEKLIEEVEKNGIDASSLIPKIQKIREYAQKEQDPLLTRALRLAWQHLETYNAFEISFLEEAETQEENLAYMLQLCLRSDNTYNRDELREMTNLLQATA
ncbi:MAG: hypothetical protein JNL57_12210 [Bacteroidetes bacterium]|nr:hypothetical protein [Bacteroidota bacterium]